ncbi:hypothetical protein GUJ93_ZPchr0003g18320 [Zizania palustris]|uniref:Uncharacterized protein n=1 Tax=Zizania palustris TaxID=103762 RepID=A0A8J5SA17_ZIZPA|nr:hypothetical protein GUJ93_ZPchr0003g18320 [Zizania palustris]
MPTAPSAYFDLFPGKLLRQREINRFDEQNWDASRTSCRVTVVMTVLAGGGRFSGETAGHRAAARGKPGVNSHTGQRECSEVCQLCRAQSGGSMSERRRIGDFAVLAASPASLLHCDAG